MQASLTAHSSQLEKALIDRASAHLTLGVLSLQSSEERAAACTALTELGPVLMAAGLLAPLALTFSGLGHFGGRVLYLDLKNGRQPNRKQSEHGGSGSGAPSCFVTAAEQSSALAACACAEQQLAEAAAGDMAPSGGDYESDYDGGRNNLMVLATVVRSHFAARHLLLDADRCLEPHVTIAKIRIPSKRRGRGGYRHGSTAGGKRGHGPGDDRPSCGHASRRKNGNEMELPQLQQVMEGSSSGPSPQRELGEDPPEQQTQPQLRRIPAEAYAAHTSISCGTPVSVAQVQLCAMQGRRRGFFYPVVASLPLLPEALETAEVAAALDVAVQMVTNAEEAAAAGVASAAGRTIGGAMPPHCALDSAMKAPVDEQVAEI